MNSKEILTELKKLSSEKSERDGQTEIDFTEDVTPKKWWMKPFVRGFLRKQQELYISDLRKELEQAS